MYITEDIDQYVFVNMFEYLSVALNRVYRYIYMMPIQFSTKLYEGNDYGCNLLTSGNLIKSKKKTVKISNG